MADLPVEPDPEFSDEAISDADARDADARRRLEREAHNVRTSLIATGVAGLVVLLWLSQQPLGLSGLFGLLSAGTFLIMSCWFVFQSAQLLVDEPLTELVRALAGQPLSVRNEARFLKRLRQECSDADLGGRSRAFSVATIVLPSVPEPEATKRRERVCGVVRALIRSKDVLGDIGTDELWVLALGAGPMAAEALSRRLRDAIAAQLNPEERPELRVGWSNFETDANDAWKMIEVAKSRALGIDGAASVAA